MKCTHHVTDRGNACAQCQKRLEGKFRALQTAAQALSDDIDAGAEHLVTVKVSQRFAVELKRVLALAGKD
jgi:hypothetical protein